MSFVTGFVLYAPGRGYVHSMDVVNPWVVFADDVWDGIMFPDWTSAVRAQHWVLSACVERVSSVSIHPIALNCGEK